MTKTEFFTHVVPAIKTVLGIDDISVWRKRWVKRVGKIIYHQKYSSRDVVDVMRRLGMKEGSVVCIHASMMQFYNFIGSAEDLITEILNAIGAEGTLMMPAFPRKPDEGYDNFIFNPAEDKTAAGYLAETFRKYPGVKRSNNVHHSVCAIGKYADYLICDHTSGKNCWDETSPWYRLCEIGGLVFNLGMPRNYIGTFHHCVEGLLYNNYPYWNRFFSINQRYRFAKPDGQIVEYYNVEGSLVRKTRESNIFKHFTEKEWRVSKISNLEIKVFYAGHALDKMLELGRKGISVYYLPSPKGYKFD